MQRKCIVAAVIGLLAWWSLALAQENPAASQPAAVATQPSSFVRAFAPMASTGTYIVLLPPDYDSTNHSYPVCVLLHGNGANELKAGAFADRLGRDGIIYIAVRAPQAKVEVMKSGEAGWSAYMSDAVPDSDVATDLALRSNYVEWIFTCVKDVQAHYRAQPGRVFIYGHSQGGSFTVACALLHPELVQAIFAHSGSRVREPFSAPENFRRLKDAGVNVHLLHGTDDTVVSPETSKTLKQTLDGVGAQCSLELIRGGHLPTEESVGIVRKWIDDEVRVPIRAAATTERVNH